MGNRDLSLSALRVLRALMINASVPHYGLELASRSGVKAGGLYPILARLEADGWITGTWEQIDERSAGRRRRRYYQLSALGERQGRKLLERTAAELDPPDPGATARRRTVWAP